MSKKKEIPENRFLRIMVPTPNQQKYSRSGFERYVNREIDPWSRGLTFTGLWDKHGLDWYFYDQTWIFRGTREYWLRYVPFFWRSGLEFFEFEARFIREATRPRGTMTQQQFIRLAKSHKAKLQAGVIQGPLLGAMAAESGVVALTANLLSKVNDVSDYLDMKKCLMKEDDYEQACAAIVSGQVTSAGTRAISR